MLLFLSKSEGEALQWLICTSPCTPPGTALKISRLCSQIVMDLVVWARKIESNWDFFSVWSLEFTTCTCIVYFPYFYHKPNSIINSITSSYSNSNTFLKNYYIFLYYVHVMFYLHDTFMQWVSVNMVKFEVFMVWVWRWWWSGM